VADARLRLIEGLVVPAELRVDPLVFQSECMDAFVASWTARGFAASTIVTVQAGGVRLIIQPGAPDVGGGRVIEEFFFDGVFVEPRDAAEPAGHGGPCAAAGFQIAAEELDVGAAGLEQRS
jgi:hypothetical protein